MSYTDAFSSNSGWVSPASFLSAPMMLQGASSVLGSAQQSAQAAPAALPGLGAGTGSSGFGFNMDTAKLGLGGLQTIGSIWNAWEAQKLAKKQFAFQKDVTETNLRNQIQSYNTTLEDRSRSRAATEGQDAATAQSYVDNNRLKR